MKHLLLLIVILISTPAHANPVTDLEEGKVISDIQQGISARHSGRYSIIEYLLKMNKSAYIRLRCIPDGEVSNDVLQRLLDGHYPNFRTIEMLWARDMEAYKRLNND